MNPARLEQRIGVYREALLSDVVPFWTRHGVDRERGGYLVCLDHDGRVFSTDKSVAMQGRMVWCHARLFREVERREEWLALASGGAQFLLEHGFDATGRAFHVISREGRPRSRPDSFDAMAFAVLGFAELALAAGASWARDAAVRTCERMLEDLGSLETPRWLRRSTRTLTRRMLVLLLAPALRRIGAAAMLEPALERSVGEVLDLFCRPELRSVVEEVDGRGRPLGGGAAVICPGHGLEVGWFLLDEARSRGDEGLAARALPMLEWSLEKGWDAQHGGLFLYTDAAGRPIGAHAGRKLWWPQLEALCATLLAHAVSGDPRWEAWFERIHEYAFRCFPDPEHGEWFGYLERDGTPAEGVARTTDGSRPRGAAKGDLQKSGFHLMRCLLVCWRLLEALQRGEGSRGAALR